MCGQGNKNGLIVVAATIPETRCHEDKALVLRQKPSPPVYNRWDGFCCFISYEPLGRVQDLDGSLSTDLRNGA